MKRGGVVVFVMLLMTGALRWASPTPLSGSPAKSAANMSMENKSLETSVRGPAADLTDAIHEFYGSPDKLGSLLSQGGDSNAPPDLNKLIPDQDKKDIRFVIAFVPDPIHTHLALFFDRSIDSIQQAVQAEGCAFDRAVIPWDSLPHKEPDDPNARQRLEAFTRDREKWPGLMIFRKSQNTATVSGNVPCVNAHVFLFLVGETPTGGIRKEQFRRSIDVIRQIRGKGGDYPIDERLYLLGPTFSGSLYSLHSALVESAPIIGSAGVTVFSGTITNALAQKWFTANAPANQYFATFQENDTYLINSFAQMACNLGYDKGEIAVISEDETEYGERISDVGSCKAKDKDDPHHAIVNIHFPREISQMRAAYQGVSPSVSANPGRRALLPLDLQLSGSDDDTVPDFAKLQIPISQEAVLLAVATALHKHHTKLVLLLATDPMDQLFLAQFLRRAYPPARVGVTAPDLLFTREGDSLLHGSFAVSAYALVPGVEDNFDRPKGMTSPLHEELFPSSLSQGLYNATVGLLESFSHPDISTGKPGSRCGKVPAAQYAAYARPSSGCSALKSHTLVPAVQLTILARDGYWLLNTLDDLKADPNIFSSLKPQVGKAEKGHDSGRHLPMSLNFAMFLLIIMGIFHVRFSHKGSVLSPWEAAAQFAPISVDRCVSRSGTRGWLIAFGAVALGSTFVLLLTARTGASFSAGWPVVGFVTIDLIALFVIFGWFLVKDLRARHKSRGAALFVAGFLAMLLVASLTIIVVHPHSMDWLWSSRGIHLTNGCSTVLAVLLLFGGWYWWMWYSLRGMVLTDDHRPRLPETGDLPESFIRLSESSTQVLRDRANPLSWSAIEVYVVLCWLLFFLVMPDRGHPIQTLEGSTFEWIFALLLAALLGLLIWNLTKLILIWGECRRLLRAIDRVPLRGIFKRLDGFGWSSLWSPGSSTLRDSYRYLARQLDSLRRLQSGIRMARKCGTKKEEVPTQVASVVDETLKLNDELQHQFQALPGQAQLPSSFISSYVDILKRTAMTAGLLAKEVLEPEWRSVPSPSATEPPQRVRDHAWFLEESAMIMLAEEYVALTYVSFLAMVLVRIRSLVVAVAGIYVFLLLSISVYPFEPNPALFSLAVVLFLVSGAVVGHVYVQMHKDATLSGLTSTNEGELDLQFWVQIVGAGAIPLLTLLAGQFPAINQVLVTVIEPALQVLK